MKRISRVAARTTRAEWKKAIAEGRVVRFSDPATPNQQTFRSYNSREAALISAEAAREDGADAVVVEPEE